MAANRTTVVIPTYGGENRTFSYLQIEDETFRLPVNAALDDIKTGEIQIDPVEVLTQTEADFLTAELRNERAESYRRRKCLLSARNILRLFVTLPAATSAAAATLLVERDASMSPIGEFAIETAITGLTVAIAAYTEFLGNKIQRQSTQAYQKYDNYLERRMALIQQYSPSNDECDLA